MFIERLYVNSKPEYAVFVIKIQMKESEHGGLEGATLYQWTYNYGNNPTWMITGNKT